MTKEQRKYILNELTAIGGKYNKKISIQARRFTKEYGYVWRKTLKGQRAYDWNLLLILADKARDLGCDVQFCRSDVESSHWRGGKTFPCPERIANAIAIFLPV